MKKTLLSITLAIAAASGAHAQAGPPKPVGFVGGIGLTGGGEKLITVEYTNGDNQDVRSGGLVHFFGGIEFAVAPQVTMQATVGYHVDNVSARNGDAKFERFPFEFLAHYEISPQFRLGGGLRYVTSSKLSGDGAAEFPTIEFKSHAGAVIEGEYLFNPHFGAKLRFVSEKYKPEFGGSSVSGDHVGLYATFHF
jgi:hypothetical protein